MNEKILVTYASKYGATREIAERIGEVLRRAGLPAEVFAVDEIRSLAPYRAVVLGSAVYIGKWQKEAARFLLSHQDALAERPVWLFSSGPTGEGDAVALLEGWRVPEELEAAVERIHPRDAAVFHGYLNPGKMNFIEKTVIHRMKKPTGDFRDWEAIVSWAAGIAEGLRDKASPVGAGA